ncbi:MAG TPA: quinoprotein dehydrogenase-associated putative ABC transporter substrate-binding protein [Tepidisphaeraceae bacterium]|nr:quinoprotein dehydrogenase-associated putative ABC transporter substrate-binding protein [Tepidisphaeraceae bacterium]
MSSASTTDVARVARVSRRVLAAAATAAVACGCAGPAGAPPSSYVAAAALDAPPAATRPVERRVLRIGADPNNLPFTNKDLAGLENRIAAIVSEELGAAPEYVWRAQRRGFFRHALAQGESDLVLAAPAGFDMGLTTRPYYRSAYAFVYRKSAKELAGLRSLDDGRLKRLKIGIQLVGDDGANAPPAHALGARGLGGNLVGYTVFGDYRDANPAARVMRALADGEVDVAVAWGPVAGFFASRSPKDELVVAPIAEAVDPLTKLPMTFEICMAVRRGNGKLRDELDGALARRRADIERVLDEYHVPRLAAREPEARGSGGNDR